MDSDRWLGVLNICMEKLSGFFRIEMKISVQDFVLSVFHNKYKLN